MVNNWTNKVSTPKIMELVGVSNITELKHKLLENDINQVKELIDQLTAGQVNVEATFDNDFFTGTNNVYDHVHKKF